MEPRFAYVTLLTSASYLAGVLVLNHCLRSVNSRYPLVVMATASLPDKARYTLYKQAINVRDVDQLLPLSNHHFHKIHDSRFTDTWTKLRAFELVEYTRVVLLDSDMIILQNMDELMTMNLPNDHIAAAHVCSCNPRRIAYYPKDWIPSNCAYSLVTHSSSPPPAIRSDSPGPFSQLNSGTVILNPSASLFASIQHRLQTSPNVGEWLFPDQDFLSEHFKGKWIPLPWYYNALRSSCIVHPALWAEQEIRCLHYIFADKPWHCRKASEDLEPSFKVLNDWWWERFDHVGDVIAKSDPFGWQYLLSTIDADK